MPRYLVIQLARFGDLVQTKRLLRTLCARGEVHLCVDRGLEALAKILYPQCVLHLLPAHGRPEASALSGVRRVMAALERCSFDAVYNLNHSGLNRGLARLFDPERVRGHAMHGPQPLHDAWVRMAFRWTRQRAIAPVNLVDFWAFFDDAPCSPAEVNPPARGQGRGLGVVLAGRESRRSLPPPVLGRCVHTAFEALGGPSVFLLGSAVERPLARQLIRQLPGHMLDRVRDLSGKTSWPDLFEALAGLDAVLTPDTGTMHLAAHLGVPVQAFFLSSAWCHETGPYGLGHTVWQSTHECAPCLESSLCGVGTACLKGFENRALLRGLAAALQARAAAAPHRDEHGDADAPQSAPCTQSLSHAAANTPLPEDMACYVSGLDAMGGVWRLAEGQDAHAPRRAALRRLVAEYLHAPLNGNRSGGLPMERELADMLYDEADWMLPRKHFRLEDA